VVWHLVESDYVTSVTSTPMSHEAMKKPCLNQTMAFSPLQRMCVVLTRSVHRDAYRRVIEAQAPFLLVPEMSQSQPSESARDTVRHRHRYLTDTCTSLGACDGAFEHPWAWPQRDATHKPWETLTNKPNPSLKGRGDGIWPLTVIEGETAGGDLCVQCRVLASAIETRLYFTGAHDSASGDGYPNEMDEHRSGALLDDACSQLGLPCTSIFEKAGAWDRAAWYIGQHYEQYYQPDTTDRSAVKPFAAALCDVARVCVGTEESAIKA